MEDRFSLVPVLVKPQIESGLRETDRCPLQRAHAEFQLPLKPSLAADSALLHQLFLPLPMHRSAAAGESGGGAASGDGGCRATAKVPPVCPLWTCPHVVPPGMLVQRQEMVERFPVKQTLPPQQLVMLPALVLVLVLVSCLRSLRQLPSLGPCGCLVDVHPTSPSPKCAVVQGVETGAASTTLRHRRSLHVTVRMLRVFNTHLSAPVHVANVGDLAGCRENAQFGRQT